MSRDSVFSSVAGGTLGRCWVRTLLVIQLSAWLLVLCWSRSVAAAANVASLASEVDLARTKTELFGVWQLAKERLALSNKLEPTQSIRRLLAPDNKQALDDWQIFEERDLPSLKFLVESRLKQLDLAAHEPPTHSVKAWGGWYETEHAEQALARRQVREIACASSPQTTQAETFLRAAETLLFDYEMDPICEELRDRDAADLLRQAADLNQGGASIKARTLILALELADEILSEDAPAFDKVDSPPSSQHWSSRVIRIAKDLLKVAYESNYPLAHIMLAKLFSEHGECDRAASHALSAILSTEALVQNLMTGSLRRVEDRAARLHASGDLDDESLFRSGFGAEEDFFEQEMHLQELARTVAEEEGGMHDGHLDIQLGDLYYFGAPEVGIPAQLEDAERMYRRALAFGNGAAASQLAAMTLNDEIEDEYEENESKRNATAFELYKRATELGDALGYVGLGLFYEQGTAPQTGGVVNKRKAAELYAQAAERGLSEGEYRLGRLYLYDQTMNNVSKGYAHMERATEKGHVGANYELGFTLFFSDHSTSACDRSFKYLLRALRSDWTSTLPFDQNRGLRALALGGKDPAAFLIFSASYVALWQPFALLNAAFVLERGHLPSYDSEAMFFTNATILGGTEHSLLSVLARRFRWPAHWRVDDGARVRNKRALGLYAHVARARQPDEGEAWRKLAECITERWPGACDDQTPVANTNALRARALFYIRKAAEYGDGESAWNMARYKALGMNGIVSRNVSASVEELNRAEELEPNAWFAIEVTRFIFSVKSWWLGDA